MRRHFGILGTLRRKSLGLRLPLRLSGLRAFTASNGRGVGGRDTCRFPVRIGGKIRPKNLLDLAAKRSPFSCSPGGLTGGCAPTRGAERRIKHGISQNA